MKIRAIYVFELYTTIFFSVCTIVLARYTFTVFLGFIFMYFYILSSFLVMKLHSDITRKKEVVN